MKTEQQNLEIRLERMDNGFVIVSCDTVPSLFFSATSEKEAMKRANQSIRTRYQHLRITGQKRPQIQFVFA